MLVMKIKSLVGFIVLALALALVVNGQGRRATKARPPREQPSPTGTPTPAPSSLSIDVGMIYTNGDVKPVARTTFYVLDEDMRLILQSVPGLIDVEKGGMVGPLLQLLSDLDSEKSRAEYDAIVSAIKSHTVAVATTDFGGKAKFSSLTPGVRFLYGEFNAGRNYAVWNMKIELEAGANLALTG